jgi:hypothetical protein
MTRRKNPAKELSKGSSGSSRGNSASRSFGLAIDTTKLGEESKAQAHGEVIERFNTLRGQN